MTWFWISSLLRCSATPVALAYAVVLRDMASTQSAQERVASHCDTDGGCPRPHCDWTLLHVQCDNAMVSDGKVIGTTNASSTTCFTYNSRLVENLHVSGKAYQPIQIHSVLRSNVARFVYMFVVCVVAPSSGLAGVMVLLMSRVTSVLLVTRAAMILGTIYNRLHQEIKETDGQPLMSQNMTAWSKINVREYTIYPVYIHIYPVYMHIYYITRTLCTLTK